MKIIREHVALSKEKPFIISLFDQPDLNYPFHHHQHAYELTITLGLSGTRIVGDSTAQFVNNDLVLMAPGLPHCWQDHGMRKHKGNKVIVVQFSSLLVHQTQKTAAHYKNIVYALEHAQYGLKLLPSYEEEAIDMANAFDERNSFENYELLLKLLNLFGRPNSTQKLCSEGYIRPVLNDQEEKLQKVLRYIQDHYSQHLPIDQVAEQVFMSPSAFSHYFKKRTLKSFSRFVSDLRLGKAAQMLQLGDMPVTQIGYECGFQNISHFNRSFKAQYDTTPLKFRKQYLLS